jgi:hypothetical protein
LSFRLSDMKANEINKLTLTNRFTLLLDSLVIRIRPRDEGDAEPISRMRTVDRHAARHAIGLELECVNLEPRVSAAAGGGE